MDQQGPCLVLLYGRDILVLLGKDSACQRLARWQLQLLWGSSRTCLMSCSLYV